MNCTILRLCLAVVLLPLGRPLLAGAEDAAATQPFAGPATRPASVVYVCDATGAMMDKMHWLRSQLTKAVIHLNPTQSFSIVFFQEANSGHVEDLIALSQDLLPATEENKSKIGDFLKNVHPRGGMNAAPALTAAMAMHPDVLYFLVDPSDIPYRPETLELLHKLNADHKTKIYTIGVVDNCGDDFQFLEKLAKENGGTFKAVDENDLAE